VKSSELDAARKRLDEVVELFRRAAGKAIDAAANPKSLPMAVTESRHQATFGLAAVGAAFKAALKLARPDDDAV
jgi:phage tail protein X